MPRWAEVVPMALFDDWADIYDRVYAYLTHDVSFYVEEATRSGGPVLELGCGTGRVSVPMAQAGVEVVGVDVSPGLITVARRKAASAGVAGRCTFKAGDMRRLRLGRRFPLVAMPFRSFQSLLSVADQVSALARVREHLALGGRLVLDVWAPDVHTLADDSDQPAHYRDVRDPATGHTLSLWHQNRWDHLHQVNSARLTVEERDQDGTLLRRLARDFQVRYTVRYEMQHLLAACGFRLVDVYGGFDRRELGEDSEDMVWVAAGTGPEAVAPTQT